MHLRTFESLGEDSSQYPISVLQLNPKCQKRWWSKLKLVTEQKNGQAKSSCKNNPSFRKRRSRGKISLFLQIRIVSSLLLVPHLRIEISQIDILNRRWIHLLLHHRRWLINLEWFAYPEKAPLSQRIVMSLQIFQREGNKWRQLHIFVCCQIKHLQNIQRNTRVYWGLNWFPPNDSCCQQFPSIKEKDFS